MAGDRGVTGAVSRRELFRRAGGAGLLLVFPGAARAARLPPAAGVREDSVMLRWNAAALEGVRSSRLGPPMVARALAIVHTSAYDAWAAHDRIAVGTRLGGAVRVPPWKRTLANKNEAVSFAAYRAAVRRSGSGSAQASARQPQL